MLAEGLTYPDAEKLIEALRNAGIEASITVGAVRLNPKVDEVKLAKDLCEAAGACVSEGVTSNLAGYILLEHSMKTDKKIKLAE